MIISNPFFPVGTKVTLCLDKLIRQTEDQKLAERMSSRVVKSASVLPPDAFIGWQMQVPVKKGRVQMFLFGSEAISQSDLEWIAEETAKTRKNTPTGQLDQALSELYEVYLPIAENTKPREVGIGANSRFTDDEFAKWPMAFCAQFAELLQALQSSGAVLRTVIGPANEEERAKCMKSSLKSFDVNRYDIRDYVGNPVRARVLLRLPSAPSIRLKTVLEEAVRGVKLRHIGRTNDPKAKAIWNAPCNGASVLPDYAARIMMLEPRLDKAVIGVELCEEKMKPLPAIHKNPSDKTAITIGKAMDITGVKRRISLSELDLRRHYQIVGQTGTGKSTMLTSIILDAIAKGHGLTFLDPHGTTIDTVLRTLPEKYADRVRVVRLGDAENPVPLNMWESDDPTPDTEERTIADLCELFGDIFNPPGEVFVGPRWERFFTTFARASLAFLGRFASFQSIAVIAQSQDNMLKVSKAIISQYPELVETIKEEYGKDKSSDWNATLSWFLCKFQRFLSDERIRATLGAGANALDFRHSIDSDSVTLIDLASPALGTHSARIAGTMILLNLWNAALQRKERERTYLVVLDEAALFQTVLPKMLVEARKFGVGIVLCHQHGEQLTHEIREALEANSANFSAFRLSPKDAAVAAIRFDDPAMQVALTRLDAFRTVTTLSVNGQQTAPFTLEIERPKKQKNGEEIAARIEAQSRKTLVEPYRALRALTAAEILDLLNNPEKREGIKGKSLLHDRRLVPPEPIQPAPSAPTAAEETEEETPYWLNYWLEKHSRLKAAG